MIGHEGSSAKSFAAGRAKRNFKRFCPPAESNVLFFCSSWGRKFLVLGEVYLALDQNRKFLDDLLSDHLLSIGKV